MIYTPEELTSSDEVASVETVQPAPKPVPVEKPAEQGPVISESDADGMRSFIAEATTRMGWSVAQLETALKWAGGVTNLSELAGPGLVRMSKFVTGKVDEFLATQTTYGPVDEAPVEAEIIP